MTALDGLSGQPVSYVLNTHWHGDHTGGNENFGKAGAVIMAHDNVRTRMSTDPFMAAFGNQVPASPDPALPIVTFSEDITFHFNGDEIDISRVPAAHTDGDSIVHFNNDNVMHKGDTFFNGGFPFIDQSSGGKLDGTITAAMHGLQLSNDDSKFRPGHGPLATRVELQLHVDMLEKVKAAMQAQLDAGRGRDEVLAEDPLATLDKTWGGGFMKTDVFTGIVFDIMTAN